MLVGEYDARGPVVWAVLLGFVGGLLLVKWRWWQLHNKSAHKARNLPPGSMGWPLLGETIEFSAALSSKTPDSFAEQHRNLYGDLFKTHLFGHPTIVSLDPDVNRFVLQNEGRYFNASYVKAFVDLFGKNSMPAARGESHKSQRDAALNFLQFKHNSGQKHLSDVESYLQLAMGSWKDRIVLVEHEARKFSFSVIMKKLLSLSWGKELEQMMNELHLLLEGSLSLRLTLVPWSTYRKAMKARKHLVEKLANIAEKRRKEIKASSCSHDDMLQFLLLRLSADGKGPISNEEIVDQMLFLLSAGHDTVASAITGSVSLLMQFPETLTQLREEHFSILGGKQPGEHLNWDDYKSMEFTQQVVNEVLRITNVAFGLFRTALDDIQIKGYTIPKGWKFLTYLRSAHLGDQIYPEPTKCNPWRWQDQNKDRPVGVTQKFLVVTCNYVARHLGVPKMASLEEAKRRCPDLVLINGEDLTPYRAASKAIMQVLSQFGTLERHGLDEAALDITEEVRKRCLSSIKMNNFSGHLVGHPTEKAHNIISNETVTLTQSLPRSAESPALFSVRSLSDETFPKSSDVIEELNISSLTGMKSSECKIVVQGITSTATITPQESRHLITSQTSTSAEALHRQGDYLLMVGSHLVADIRAAVERETGYCCSSGIAHNKLLAKLACSINKPNKQTCILSSAAKDFLRPLPVRKIPGVGQRMECTLNEMGIRIVEDIERFTLQQLCGKFGHKIGYFLYNACHGLDPTPIVDKGHAKSLSVEDSFRNCTSLQHAKNIMQALAPDLLARVDQDKLETGRSPKAFSVKWRLQGNLNFSSLSTPMPLEVLSTALPIERREDLVVQTGMKLLARGLHGTNFSLVVLNIGATKFSSDVTGASAASCDIRTFLQSPLKSPITTKKSLSKHEARLCREGNEKQVGKGLELDSACNHKKLCNQSNAFCRGDVSCLDQEDVSDCSTCSDDEGGDISTNPNRKFPPNQPQEITSQNLCQWSSVPDDTLFQGMQLKRISTSTTEIFGAPNDNQVSNSKDNIMLSHMEIHNHVKPLIGDKRDMDPLSFDGYTLMNAKGHLSMLYKHEKHIMHDALTSSVQINPSSTMETSSNVNPKETGSNDVLASRGFSVRTLDCVENRSSSSTQVFEHSENLIHQPLTLNPSSSERTSADIDMYLREDQLLASTSSFVNVSCSMCGKLLFTEQLRQEHADYHFALDLQKQENSVDRNSSDLNASRLKRHTNQRGTLDSFVHKHKKG